MTALKKRALGTFARAAASSSAETASTTVSFARMVISLTGTSTASAKSGDDAPTRYSWTSAVSLNVITPPASATDSFTTSSSRPFSSEKVLIRTAVVSSGTTESSPDRSFAITSGEAHISTAVENGIQVAEDGVTATWQYANSDLSGNAAILTLVLDGETIYTSEALKPGETVETLTLDKALASGEYQAMAVTTVYDAAGEAQLTSRVPVTINVR